MKGNWLDCSDDPLNDISGIICYKSGQITNLYARTLVMATDTNMQKPVWITQNPQ